MFAPGRPPHAIDEDNTTCSTTLGEPTAEAPMFNPQRVEAAIHSMPLDVAPSKSDAPPPIADPEAVAVLAPLTHGEDRAAVGKAKVARLRVVKPNLVDCLRVRRR